MSEQEKRGNQETDPVQEALRRIEKKSDITLIIAILILVVGLFIHLVFKALRGRRSEEEPKEGIHSKP